MYKYKLSEGHVVYKYILLIKKNLYLASLGIVNRPFQFVETRFTGMSKECDLHSTNIIDYVLHLYLYIALSFSYASTLFWACDGMHVQSHAKYHQHQRSSE